MYDIITLIVEGHDNFIHILAERKRNEAFVVDPAWDAEGIREVLAEEGLTLTGILITHSHHDHVNAVSELYRGRGLHGQQAKHGQNGNFDKPSACM